MKRHSRIIPDPFVIGPSGNQTVDPRPTSRGNHQILSQKDPLQAVGLLLWLVQMQEILHLPSYTLAIQGTLRPYLVFKQVEHYPVPKNQPFSRFALVFQSV